MNRRPLVFETLDDVMADARRLHETGYAATGAWDLPRVCSHLAAWMSYPLDGFPMKPFPWLFRVTVGSFVLGRILRSRSMTTGIPTAPASVPAAGGDAAAAIETLSRAVDRFTAHSGDVVPSPFFGRMTREQCRQLQLVHCAHHLSFLIPSGDP